MVNHRLMFKKLNDTTIYYEFVRIFEALLVTKDSSKIIRAKIVGGESPKTISLKEVC